MTWLSSPWPCSGMTGSHGNSDVIVGSRRVKYEKVMFVGLFLGEMKCLLTHGQTGTALCVSRLGNQSVQNL